MYKRVLLKLSGEALGIKDSSNIIDVESLHSICEKIKILHDDGMEVAIVIGAGNIWRGKVAEKIEVLKKININLRNLIKILYKNYFESFELNNVPDDWEQVNIGSIIDIYNGYSYKGTELQESDCGMVTIKNFNRDGSFRIDGFKEIVYQIKLRNITS